MCRFAFQFWGSEGSNALQENMLCTFFNRIEGHAFENIEHAMTELVRASAARNRFAVHEKAVWMGRFIRILEVSKRQ